MISLEAQHFASLRTARIAVRCVSEARLLDLIFPGRDREEKDQHQQESDLNE